MTFKRTLSILLAVAMVLSCAVVIGTAVASGASADIAEVTYQDVLAMTSADNDYGLSPTVNDGTILQAWNWSFENIEANLPKLAEQGFTTIQVSPPNEIKAGTKGVKVLQSDGKNGWWMFYQPAGFQLNESTDNALGTKEQFVSMCSEAKKYGIKIIVDAVINHMGTCDNEDGISSINPMDHLTPRAAQFESEIVNAQAFHKPWANMTYKEDPNQFSQYDSTYDLTRNCTSRLPDLDTGSQIVQKAIYDYMDELIAAGASGFRFDAAKHIETPDDISSLRSDFWTKTLGAVRTKYQGQNEVYAYGEILNTCGVNRPFSMYTKLFDVTDSGSYWGIKDAATTGGGNATPYYPNTNFTKANTILWDESHDTYMDGATTSLNVTQRGKIWALCAGRADITTVYFARPDDSTSTNACYNVTLGDAKQTAWANTTTKGINQFHNAFIGQSEYCTANSNGYAYIERGTTGAVIVRLGNATSGSVSVQSHVLKAGSYKDLITGNVFKVANNRITGNVGGSGVACIVYDADAPQPTEDPNPPTYPTQPSLDDIPTRDGCYTVVFSNSKGWTGSMNIYYWTTGQDGPNPWPGISMDFYQQNEYGENQYIGFVPVEYDNVIINNGEVQLADTPISSHIGLYATDKQDAQGHYIAGTWDLPISPTPPVTEPPVTEPPVTEPVTQPVVTEPVTEPVTQPVTQPVTDPAGKITYLLGDADGDNEVTVLDATRIQRVLAKLDTIADKRSEYASDADEDNEVTVLDATRIQRWLAKLEPDCNVNKTLSKDA